MTKTLWHYYGQKPLEIKINIYLKTPENILSRITNTGEDTQYCPDRSFRSGRLRFRWISMGFPRYANLDLMVFSTVGPTIIVLLIATKF